MRIVHRNLKHGKIKLMTETLDDLWHLQHLLEPGNLATALTRRREKSETDKVQLENEEKKPVKLSINLGAVRTLLVTNRQLKRKREEMDSLLEDVRKPKHEADNVWPG